MMKQNIVTRQYVPRLWYGQPAVPISKKQCKRAPRVLREPLMLKFISLKNRIM